MKRVFVTGANGMLGNMVCRQLIEQNYSVKALCLLEDKSKTLNGLHLDIVYGDVLNKSFILEAMKGCDYVIHIAALTSLSPSRNPKVNKVNIEGTKNVMEAAEQLKIKRMVHVGSASSFNHGTKKIPGTEKNEFKGWHFGMDYMDSKYVAQKMLLERFSNHGFPVIIINPTFMIGPYDSGPSSGKMLISFFKDALPGYTNGGKNFVCSRDVACAIVNALTLGSVGECYIAGNENLNYKEFFELSSSVMHKPFTLKKLPKPVVELAGIFGSVVSRITNKPSKISYGVAKLANVPQYYSSEKARRELNMSQTPLKEAIKESMKWFQENGYLN